MATFDRDSLRNAVVENGQIRYKDDVPVTYLDMTNQDLIADENGIDHWDGTGYYK